MGGLAYHVLNRASAGGLWFATQTDYAATRGVKDSRPLFFARDKPFITSDRPVLAQWDQTQNVRLVTFPVSSEVALVIITGGQFNEARDRCIEARAMNRGTMDGATDFVVACKQNFPCDDFLTTGRSRKS